MQAGNHEVDLLGEIGAEVLEMLLRVVQQQNGRRDFHGHAVVVARTILGQPVGDGTKPLAKTLEIGMADARGEVGTLTGLLDKSAQTGRAAGAHLVPQLFGGGDHIPQATQGSFVRLANDELAVVVKRGRRANTPLVFSIVGRSGMPLGEPAPRDTSERQYEIKGNVPSEEVRVVLNPARLLARI